MQMHFCRINSRSTISPSSAIVRKFHASMLTYTSPMSSMQVRPAVMQRWSLMQKCPLYPLQAPSPYPASVGHPLSAAAAATGLLGGWLAGRMSADVTMQYINDSKCAGDNKTTPARLSGVRVEHWRRYSAWRQPGKDGDSRRASALNSIAACARVSHR